MDVNIRPATPADAVQCGRIIYEAFKAIAEQHNFPPDFPDGEVATHFVSAFIENPSVYGVVAEADGRVVGSNFLTEHDPVRAVGPITIDPAAQGRGIGRRLMEAVIERGRDAAGVRLMQDAFNTRSLSLYASLGFEVREPVVLMEGRFREGAWSGVEVREMGADDVAACEELCVKVHGFSRAGDLRGKPPTFTSFVALRGGRVVAYASAPHFWPLNHAVAETEGDMRALLSGASAWCEQPLSFLVPTRQAGLFRWLLGEGMRVVKPATMMTMGDYVEPRGCYLPSVGY
jgi:GNAT superfamily N-acetyltransferase